MGNNWGKTGEKPSQKSTSDDHRQIEPTLPGVDIGNVGDPDLIGPDDGKLPLHAIWSHNGRSPGLCGVALYSRARLLFGSVA